jgi:hypothetical protein
MDFDVLIKGGEVVDGTGSPRRQADVGVRTAVSSLDHLDGAQAAGDRAGDWRSPDSSTSTSTLSSRALGNRQFAGARRRDVGAHVTRRLQLGAAARPAARGQDYLQVFYGDPDVGWD